jgi:O-antigen/teichoic acid export membrane protein
VVAALASIATIRVLTGLLRPAAFGEYGLALTAATLAQQCLMGPIAMAAVRYYAPSSDAGTLRAYVRAVAGLAAAGSLALAALTLAASLFIPNPWAAAVYSWMLAIGSLVDGVQNAARQRKLVAIHEGAGGWLRLLFVIVAARIWGASSTSTLWAYSAGYAVSIASQSFFLWRVLARSAQFNCEHPVTEAPARPIASSMVSYAWPFAAWGVFTWMQASADRWSLNAFSGLYHTGLYQSLYQLGYYPAALMTQFLLQVATPILFARAGRGGIEDGNAAERWNNRLMYAAIGCTLAGAAVSAAGGHKLLALLLAPDYRGQSALVTPLILASGFFAAAQIGALNSMITMNTRRLIAPKIVTALGGTGLLALGAYAAGTPGVVAGQLGFSTAYLVWMCILNRRHAAPGAARPVVTGDPRPATAG